MKDYLQKSMNALRLAGLSERTQESYTRAVRQIVEFFEQTPDQITEEQLQEYFLHRSMVDEWKPSTLRIAQTGIKFFFINVLKREWHLFSYLSVKREQQLPCVLSREQVYAILQKVTTFHNYAYLSTVYSCGLRLSEGLNLQVSDIDKNRMLIHVHRGKGAKDRLVPLPEDTYHLLRQYWPTHKNPDLIFPALGRGQNLGPTSKNPMSIEGVQGAFRRAKVAAGIKKRRVSIHTLRHCYATHLLEAGVNIRAIQRYMGHARLETTMVYLHLTQRGMQDSYAIINDLMKGPQNDDHN